MDDDFLADIMARMEEERRKEHPDYRNTVYCDVHLGVKMVLALSWGSVQFGETSVDVNPNNLWLCPKPDCDRHYEPTMFGYHINVPGHRLGPETAKQPRGNHPSLPFMYIGKFGEGRRYMCPLYTCEEEGPVVSDAVVDEDIQLPADPLANLKSAERKRALEMLVFQSFASASGLAIDIGSAENRDPDYPDILCTIAGQSYWFELGQIIHEDVAEKLNPRRRKQEGGFSYDQEQPFVELVNTKATKKYKTEGAPVDLVLHFDLRFGSAATAERLAGKHAALLASLTATGPFARVWIFDEYARRVVWSKV